LLDSFREELLQSFALFVVLRGLQRVRPLEVAFVLKETDIARAALGTDINLFERCFVERNAGAAGAAGLHFGQMIQKRIE
jgi:hypothetical protein